MHCLLYQTIVAPESLIFILHGQREGQGHDLTNFFKETDMEEKLSAVLIIDFV